jgi:hypothetical protein
MYNFGEEMEFAAYWLAYFHTYALSDNAVVKAMIYKWSVQK